MDQSINCTGPWKLEEESSSIINLQLVVQIEGEKESVSRERSGNTSAFHPIAFFKYSPSTLVQHQNNKKSSKGSSLFSLFFFFSFFGTRKEKGRDWNKDLPSHPDSHLVLS